MRKNQIWQGIGIALLAGAAISMAMSPGKKNMRSKASKAVHAVENAASHISDALNF